MASTFMRLAGMQEVSRSNAATPQPPPHTSSGLSHDTESQSIHAVTRPSRAAVPADRRLSRKSASIKSRNSLGAPPTGDLPPLPTESVVQNGVTYSATKSSLPDRRRNDQDYIATGPAQSENEDEDEAPAEGEEEIAWGPSHPCFPHPNPHIPTSDPAYATTKVIRVRRDWLVAGDSYPQFQNLYPEILADWLSESDFRAFVDELNEKLRTAFRPDSARAVVDALMGFVTGFVWDDLGLTGVKAGVKGLEKWMEGWNEERKRMGSEISVIPLRRTGFLNLDFVIPDPGIDVVGEGEAVDGDL